MIQVEMRLVFVLIVACWLPTMHAAAQTVTATLMVRDDQRTVPLALEQVAALPQTAAVVQEGDAMVRYEGVRLAELLSRAGVPFDAATRGRRLTGYVIAAAPDGFRAVIALAEVDPEFTEREMLVAIRRDGRPLSDRDGPFRLIVPGDKLRGRWVRQLATLIIMQAPEVR
jgi:hypothetical protein